MRSSPLAAALLLALAVISFGPAPTEAIRFRCGILGWLPKDFACRSTCWATGHKTGHCDEDNDCVCEHKGQVRDSPYGFSKFFSLQLQSMPCALLATGK